MIRIIILLSALASCTIYALTAESYSYIAMILVSVFGLAILFNALYGKDHVQNETPEESSAKQCEDVGDPLVAEDIISSPDWEESQEIPAEKKIHPKSYHRGDVLQFFWEADKKWKTCQLDGSCATGGWFVNAVGFYRFWVPEVCLYELYKPIDCPRHGQLVQVWDKNILKLVVCEYHREREGEAAKCLTVGGGNPIRGNDGKFYEVPEKTIVELHRKGIISAHTLMEELGFDYNEQPQGTETRVIDGSKTDNVWADEPLSMPDMEQTIKKELLAIPCRKPSDSNSPLESKLCEKHQKEENWSWGNFREVAIKNGWNVEIISNRLTHSHCRFARPKKLNVEIEEGKTPHPDLMELARRDLIELKLPESCFLEVRRQNPSTEDKLSPPIEKFWLREGVRLCESENVPKILHLTRSGKPKLAENHTFGNFCEAAQKADWGYSFNSKGELLWIARRKMTGTTKSAPLVVRHHEHKTVDLQLQELVLRGLVQLMPLRHNPQKTKQQLKSESKTLACPYCADAMIKKTNGQTGGEFFGCKRFPACKGTRGLDGSLGKTAREYVALKKKQPLPVITPENERRSSFKFRPLGSYFYIKEFHVPFLEKIYRTDPADAENFEKVLSAKLSYISGKYFCIRIFDYSDREFKMLKLTPQQAKPFLTWEHATHAHVGGRRSGGCWELYPRSVVPDNNVYTKLLFIKPEPLNSGLIAHSREFLFTQTRKEILGLCDVEQLKADLEDRSFLA